MQRQQTRPSDETQGSAAFSYSVLWPVVCAGSSTMPNKEPAIRQGNASISPWQCCRVCAPKQNRIQLARALAPAQKCWGCSSEPMRHALRCLWWGLLAFFFDWNAAAAAAVLGGGLLCLRFAVPPALVLPSHRSVCA